MQRDFGIDLKAAKLNYFVSSFEISVFLFMSWKKYYTVE